jgi:hypothetical protein
MIKDKSIKRKEMKINNEMKNLSSTINQIKMKESIFRDRKHLHKALISHQLNNFSSLKHYNYRLYLLNKRKNQLKHHLIKHKISSSGPINSNIKKVHHIYRKSRGQISYHSNYPHIHKTDTKRLSRNKKIDHHHHHHHKNISRPIKTKVKNRKENYKRYVIENDKSNRNEQKKLKDNPSQYHELKSKNKNKGKIEDEEENENNISDSEWEDDTESENDSDNNNGSSSSSSSSSCSCSSSCSSSTSNSNNNISRKPKIEKSIKNSATDIKKNKNMTLNNNDNNNNNRENSRNFNRKADKNKKSNKLESSSKEKNDIYYTTNENKLAITDNKKNNNIKREEINKMKKTKTRIENNDNTPENNISTTAEKDENSNNNINNMKTKKKDDNNNNNDIKNKSQNITSDKSMQTLEIIEANYLLFNNNDAINDNYNINNTINNNNNNIQNNFQSNLKNNKNVKTKNNTDTTDHDIDDPAIKNLQIYNIEELSKEELKELKSFKLDMVHFFDNIQYNKSKASDFIMDDKGDLDSNGLTLDNRLKFMNYGDQLKKKCFQLIRLYNIFSNQLDEVVKSYT